MSSIAAATADTTSNAVAEEARKGLTAYPRTLSPWLFYDEIGSRLFEQITALPEYYLTRIERGIFSEYADEILREAAGEEKQQLTLIELGAGTAAKTGILLAAALRQQGSVVYQPVDVSESALDLASRNIQANFPGVSVRCQVADYTREPLPLDRLRGLRTLALYIGSSIGNFSPEAARSLLRNVRAQLLPGDKLLLGADLVPGPHKNVEELLAAYNDSFGVTAAFNRNVLIRLNRELGADFHPADFAHRAIWNARLSRIEMHLVSLMRQRVYIPANSAGPDLVLEFEAGETIHTENSYKFTPTDVEALLAKANFEVARLWQDPRQLFSVTLATAV
ncbi:MAG TPA: L-histidine N(alpha)-methyltransferase [Edaphobacter sp.]|nr:L-histidine N(alpha)-methyltransferase [Edaphobacter sp.]